MAKAAQKEDAGININLMPSQEVPGAVGGAIHWVLTIGRYLIIFTEIIALAIFILSIKLSTDKNNLKEDIQQLSSQVADKSSFEKDFRTTQQKINDIKTLKANRYPNYEILSEFLSLLPKGLTLKSLEITEGTISFSGEFTKPSELQTLVASFTSSDKITGLDISELKHPTDENPKYTFSASVLVIIDNFNKEEKT